MCVTRYKIHRKSALFASLGKNYVFAPCGKCEDCRKHTQYAWAWRLTSDIQYAVEKKGYKVGFITLTYNDAHLPRFPAFTDVASVPENPLAGLPCFSKEDTENLILYIRKVSNRDRGIKDWLYFLACEFGPATQRPHMHMIISWPSESVKVVRERGTGCVKSRTRYVNDAAYVHELIRHYWVEYACKGFVSPDTPQGGKSKRSGKKYLPFQVGSLADCMNSAFYTAKYVTKDVYFCSDMLQRLRDAIRLHSCDLYHLDEQVKAVWNYLKPWLPHHRQTKSLGFQSVASLSDAEKIKLLNVGKSFLGSDKLSLPPMYIKNKLMFKPCYFVDSKGNRLVKQECTDFFNRNFAEIMDKKEKYFAALFESWKDDQYWLSSGLSPEHAADAAWFVRMNDVFDKFGCSLSQAYIYYYGLPWKMCFKSRELTYKNRYLSSFFGAKLERIDFLLWKNIQSFFDYIMQFVGWKQESQIDYDVDYIRDYMNQPLEQIA